MKRKSLFSVADLKSDQVDSLKFESSSIRVHGKIKTSLSPAQMSLADAIGKLEHDATIHYVSRATWSNHDMIEYFADQCGSMHIVAATWSMSESVAVKLAKMIQEKKILSLKIVIDFRTNAYAREAVAVAMEHFAEVRIARVHAKVTVLHNDLWDIAIVSSANMTNNTCIEAGVIDTNKQVAVFHRSWIENLMRDATYFEATKNG